MQVGEQIAEQWVGREAVGQRVGNPRRRHRAGLSQALTHGVGEAGPAFGGQMQQHFLVRGEVATYPRIMHARATGDVGQGHRRDTGFQRQ